MSNDKDTIGEQNEVKINRNFIVPLSWQSKNSQILSRLYPNWCYTAANFWRIHNLGDCIFNHVFHRLIEGF